MKKSVKNTTFVFVTVWAIFATFLFLITRDANNEKYEKIQQLEAEVQEFKEKSGGDDMGIIDVNNEFVQPVEKETLDTLLELPSNETTSETPVGSSKSNPYVLTVAELVEEIKTDTSAAKSKYNGKWIEITGEINGTSTSGFGYGYYLHGESVTTGYSGLRIMCWCDSLPYSKTKLGDTLTFVGQVLEITTVNATEIVDCELIK